MEWNGRQSQGVRQYADRYADLTGEVLFIRDTMGQLPAGGCPQAAARTGARIVHSCGFDPVPSDLGVLLTHEAAAADGAGDLEDTTLVLTAMRGAVTGGTLASALGQLEDMRASASKRRIVTDPYAPSPESRRGTCPRRARAGHREDEAGGDAAHLPRLRAIPQ